MMGQTYGRRLLSGDIEESDFQEVSQFQDIQFVFSSVRLLILTRIAFPFTRFYDWAGCRWTQPKHPNPSPFQTQYPNTSETKMRF